MVDTQFLSAIIVAVIVSILAPLIFGWVKGAAEKQAMEKAAQVTAKEKAELLALRAQDAADRRAEKEQDWARQDKVAERADAASRRLLDSQTLMAQKADEAALLLAAAGTEITDRLQIIDDQGKVNHILLNSNMTRAMQNDLDGKRLLVLALRRIAGTEGASQDDSDLLLVTEAKITVLENDLTERAEQQRLADAQIRRQSPDDATIPAG